MRVGPHAGLSRESIHQSGRRHVREVPTFGHGASNLHGDLHRSVVGFERA
jgi:hypothetical protein